jgi:light-regulated signal transduction histidine kinase (bacteriophytochrome)
MTMRRWWWFGTSPVPDRPLSGVEAELAKARERIAALEAELAETNRGMMAMAWEVEKRVEERTRELGAAHEELRQTNSDVMCSALELEAANKELEAFAHSVSHDLRAPLRSVGGFAKMLEEAHAGQLDPRGRDHLRRIQRASQRMSSMIDDLLKLARMARGEVRRRPLDLAAMAREIAQELQASNPDRQVQFAIAGALPVEGDEGLLRGVLENLLGNAWKFTSKTADARIEMGELPDGVFFIRDNGAGFDMAYAHQLFSAFKRLHREAEFPGTGVGLATVRRIVQRHGGRTWAESEIGKGATFYFTIKAADAAEPGSQAGGAS